MTYGSGDLGYLFRTQTSRSMNDLDKLIQLKLSYANKLGEDKVKEIVLEKKIEEREHDKNQLFKRKNEINTKNKLKVNILCVKNN